MLHFQEYTKTSQDSQLGKKKSESILHAITTGITLFHFSTAGTKPTRISYETVYYQPYYKQLIYKKKHKFFSSNEIY